MTKDELIAEFSKLNEYDAFYVLIQLLKNGKLDYVLLSQAYVKYLEYKNKDMNELQCETETCAFQLLDAHEIRGKKKEQSFLDAVHRFIYLLDITKRWPTQWMKDKYGYNETEAKELSMYGMRYR